MLSQTFTQSALANQTLADYAKILLFKKDMMGILVHFVLNALIFVSLLDIGHSSTPTLRYNYMIHSKE